MLQPSCPVFIINCDRYVRRRGNKRLIQIELTLLFLGHSLTTNNLPLPTTSLLLRLLTRLPLLYNACFVEFVATPIKYKGFYLQILNHRIEAEVEIDSHWLRNRVPGIACCTTTGVANIERENARVENAEPIIICTISLLSNMLAELEQYVSVN